MKGSMPKLGDKLSIAGKHVVVTGVTQTHDSHEPDVEAEMQAAHMAHSYRVKSELGVGWKSALANSPIKAETKQMKSSRQHNSNHHNSIYGKLQTP